MTASSNWHLVDPGERSESGRPRYDPATRYAIEVVQGSIVAPDKVVKVYERHLDMLDRSKLPGSGTSWQPRELARFYHFCRSHCMIPDRLQAEIKMLELLPAYMGAYGPVSFAGRSDNPTGDPKIDPQERKHGSALYRTMLLETPKSSGKTPTAAALILYHLTGQLPPPARPGVKPEDPPVVFVGTDLMDQNIVIRGFMDRMLGGRFLRPRRGRRGIRAGRVLLRDDEGRVPAQERERPGPGNVGVRPVPASVRRMPGLGSDDPPGTTC